MEGIARLPGSRLAEIAREYPEAAICRVDRILRAEKFTPDGEFIGLVYGYTEEELAAKLRG